MTLTAKSFRRAVLRFAVFALLALAGSQSHGARGVFGPRRGDFSTPYQRAVIANNPTYWWWASDASGDFMDHADSNPGVVTGLFNYQQPTLVAGETFSVLQNGPGIYCTINTVSLTGDFTLEWWYQLPTGPTGFSPFWSPATGDHPAVYWFNGRLSVFDSNNSEAAFTATLNDLNTHYIVVTRSGTTVKLYADGSNVTAGSGTWTGSLTFAIRFFLHMDGFGNNSEYWQMGAIYVGQALTATDVTNHWNAGH